MTLDEAITLAKENLPSYKASLIRVKSTEALYSASLSPYLPNLDASVSDERIFTSAGEFKTRNYNLALSYTLFDWGNRKANRDISRLNLNEYPVYGGNYYRRHPCRDLSIAKSYQNSAGRRDKIVICYS